jgi:hypothetical protein
MSEDNYRQVALGSVSIPNPYAFKEESIALAAVLPGYADGGGVAIAASDAETGEPYAMVSVNMREAQGLLAPDEFCAKTWSENAHMRDALLASGMFQDTGRRIGLVGAEIWKITVPGWEQAKAA